MYEHTLYRVYKLNNLIIVYTYTKRIQRLRYWSDHYLVKNKFIIRKSNTATKNQHKETKKHLKDLGIGNP